MTIQILKDTASPAVLRSLAGLGAIALIAVGVWALYGWPVALIVACLPFAAFYIWGEAQAMRTPNRGAVSQELD